MFKEMDHFLQNGFDTREHPLPGYGLEKGFKANKSGSNNVLFRYTDYYFIYKTDKNVNLKWLKEIHQESKRIANLDFKLPKAFRLKVPNINTVIITDAKVSTDIKEYVGKIRKLTMGGEQESIFIFDNNLKELHTSGIEMTSISGEAKLIWGNQKQFKEINGRNRSFYFLRNFFAKVYTT